MNDKPIHGSNDDRELHHSYWKPRPYLETARRVVEQLDKAKTCAFTYSIHFREGRPKYCVEVTCLTHNPKYCWTALTDDLELAKNTIENFPLVSGGLIIPRGRSPKCVNDDCIIGKIPRVL